MAQFQYPSPLKSGSTVALIAPAFSFDQARFEAGCKTLQSVYGLKPKFLETIFDKKGYFAGSDERRLEELYQWFTDPEVDGILAIRGGYGCTRIYPELIKKLKSHKGLKPKVLVGYSDLTIILNGLYQDLGWITFHGPVIAGRPFENPLPREQETFEKSVFTTSPLGKLTDPDMICIEPGSAEAPLVGGNLALVVASLGTSYEVDTKNKILFLEDVTESPYRIDRLLTQLLHAGKLSSAKGILFGNMTNCGSQDEVLEAIRFALEPLLKKHSMPVLFDFPAGHGETQLTFPMGCKVKMESSNKNCSVEFLEAGAK